ncbi:MULTISPECIES: class D beta-lactamase [unclassified Aureimonas]|uniref:class D beta-lactamase n=1 Tax=unclassified Aureimonas TaxID=2615206 RepID=UPI0006F6AC99|nr:MULTISPECIES: class D beta-lactamase [unclassified Aureimonas]KQT66264.1 class D beta-lactamase [Aureimonas sp. Leaf427]KQT72453.1 class D beta-lactamase [Aureimonas sp. Leaf460]
MSRSKWLRLALVAAVLSPGAAGARTICTVVADASDGRVLVEEGDCRTRVTPASTFKVPLALMGFDSGLLADAKSPVLPFKTGDVDWGGENWRQDTDPTRWMTYSVVWYSQRLTHRLGADRLSDYARRFGFGNADFSGDPGKDNGLDRAWIMSSLKISPVEQVAFWRRFVNRELPVSRHAFEETDAIVESWPLKAGWTARGKTGSALPRKRDGSFDEARSFGWFVGSAEKAGRRLVLARLIQDDRKEKTSAGLRAREAILEELPGLVEAAREP